MTTLPMPPPEAILALAEFLRRERAMILGEWQAELRQARRGACGSPSADGDASLKVLERIAERVEATGVSRPGPPERVRREAAPRLAPPRALDAGFDLAEMVHEYAVLRDCILRLWHEAAGPTELRALRALNEAIDEAVASSVDRYVAARGRTLEALDRISAESLQAPSLDDLLPRLLHVFREVTHNVDTVALLLRENGVLRMRAAIGLEQEVSRGFAIRIGEGFAGAIAAEQRPLAIDDPARDPRVRGSALRHSRVSALYGVPLIEDGAVIGVAEMGSLSAQRFTPQDEEIFQSMASRAAVAIAQQRLRDERRSLVEMLELGDPCLLIDSRWRIAFVNGNQEQLSQKPRSQTLGRVFWEVWPEATAPDLRFWREYHRVMEERVRADFEEYFPPLNLWTHVTAYPTSDGGIAIFLRDSSERKRFEETRERFIGVLGHDLRDPLQAIAMVGHGLLLRDDLPQPLTQGVGRILSAVDRMQSIISSVLDWTRIRLGGGLPLSCRPMELGELCSRVVDELRSAHPDRTIELGRGGEVHGSWDPDRMAQVVSNLIGNAIQHGAASEPIQLAVGSDADGALIEVHNHGVPIPQDMLGRIFEPFVGVVQRNASTPPRGNVGLGLYIVQEIVRAHGGRLDVESSGGAGTTFRVRLPPSS